jgi:hypothetical protein
MQYHPPHRHQDSDGDDSEVDVAFILGANRPMASVPWNRIPLEALEERAINTQDDSTLNSQQPEASSPEVGRLRRVPSMENLREVDCEILANRLSEVFPVDSTLQMGCPGGDWDPPLHQFPLAEFR